MEWMRIDWLDLPKLTTLRTTAEKVGGQYSNTFGNPRHITLESDFHPLWMMLRHAQSHQCGSHGVCILLQEWRHNHRKCSLHPSLTNRYRSSSRQVQLITKRHVTPLFVPHTHTHPLPIHLRAYSAALERALSLCEHGNNDDPHLKWWKSNQNRGNSK